MHIDHSAPLVVSGAPDESLASHQFMGVDGLARFTGLARSTILSDLSRAPWKIPPCYRLPGRRKLLWQREEVAAWIKRFPAFRSQAHDRNPEGSHVPERRGRPRAADKLRAHGSAVVELNAQGRA